MLNNNIETGFMEVIGFCKHKIKLHVVYPNFGEISHHTHTHIVLSSILQWLIHLPKNPGLLGRDPCPEISMFFLGPGFFSLWDEFGLKIRASKQIIKANE